MRILLSLLFVVLVLYMLSNVLIRSGPVATRGQPGSEPGSRSASGHSEAVRQRLDDSSRSYQQKLEQSMEGAGAGQ